MRLGGVRLCMVWTNRYLKNNLGIRYKVYIQMARNENILVRVSKFENKRINDNAKSFGLNKSSFIRKVTTSINKLKIDKPSIENIKIDKATSGKPIKFLLENLD